MTKMERLMKTVEVSDSEMEALDEVLDYLWVDEEEDCAARVQDCERENHIYSSLMKLRDLLNRMRG
jgi:hypothetical protein